MNSIEAIRIEGAPGSRAAAESPDPEISSIHYRAQEVQPDGMFVAIPGSTADGHDFIDDALRRGAAAIVVQKEARPLRLSPPQADDPSASPGSHPPATQGTSGHGGGQVNKDALIMQVSNTRKALATMSATFYGNPSAHLGLIGITGTNGKTTTAYIIESILQKAGYRVGVIGTINYRFAGRTFDNPITTPESMDLQRIFAEMQQAGITHVVMEVSSHAIDLYRIQNCWFDAGVFTNLSQDHLDFHGDMPSYWSSKKRLFTEYLSSGPKKDKVRAVINCKNAYGRELADMLAMPVIEIGTAADAAVKMGKVRCDLSGITGTIETPDGSFDFKSPLVGEHNLENILCACGVGSALGLGPDVIKSGVESVSHIPGRLERIENSAGRFVYVDYAHTPDALENVITALQAITTDRIICVFGCGGDRDQKKRPLMGEIAVKHCDLSIVTSDNPRTEAPLAIIEHILAGIKKANGHAYLAPELQNGFSAKGYVVEPDRRRAIELGVKTARPGDTVLIAGKGHETYQILGSKTIAFDDREVARRFLSKLEA